VWENLRRVLFVVDMGVYSHPFGRARTGWYYLAEIFVQYGGHPTVSENDIPHSESFIPRPFRRWISDAPPGAFFPPAASERCRTGTGKGHAEVMLWMLDNNLRHSDGQISHRLRSEISARSKNWYFLVSRSITRHRTFGPWQEYDHQTSNIKHQTFHYHCPSCPYFPSVHRLHPASPFCPSINPLHHDTDSQNARDIRGWRFEAPAFPLCGGGGAYQEAAWPR
jgi:hypothetical protein